MCNVRVLTYHNTRFWINLSNYSSLASNEGSISYLFILIFAKEIFHIYLFWVSRSNEGSISYLFHLSFAIEWRKYFISILFEFRDRMKEIFHIFFIWVSRSNEGSISYLFYLTFATDNRLTPYRGRRKYSDNRVYAFHISHSYFSHISQTYLRRLGNLRDFLNFPFKSHQKRPITVNLIFLENLPHVRRRVWEI
jgi:hypothetical protein